MTNAKRSLAVKHVIILSAAMLVVSCKDDSRTRGNVGQALQTAAMPAGRVPGTRTVASCPGGEAVARVPVCSWANSGTAFVWGTIESISPALTPWRAASNQPTGFHSDPCPGPAQVPALKVVLRVAGSHHPVPSQLEFFIGAARVADMVPTPTAQGDTVVWNDADGAPAPLQVGTGLAAVLHRLSETTWSLVGDLMFAKDQNGRPDFGPGNLENCAGPARPDVGTNTADELIALVQACSAIQDEAAAARQAEVMSVIGDRAMVDAAICFFPDVDGGPKCMSMDDCRPGETCGSAGSCVTAVRCGGAQDCRAGEACVDAVCQVRR